MGSLVLPSSLHRKSKQTDFLNSREEFFSLGLYYVTGHGHPSPQKIAKMALLNPCMKLISLFDVLRKCRFVTLSKICLRLRPSAYPSL